MNEKTILNGEQEAFIDYMQSRRDLDAAEQRKSQAFDFFYAKSNEAHAAFLAYKKLSTEFDEASNAAVAAECTWNLLKK